MTLQPLGGGVSGVSVLGGGGGLVGSGLLEPSIHPSVPFPPSISEQQASMSTRPEYSTTEILQGLVNAIKTLDAIETSNKTLADEFISVSRDLSQRYQAISEAIGN